METELQWPETKSWDPDLNIILFMCHQTLDALFTRDQGAQTEGIEVM